MARGAWRAAVHAVTKSRTRLSDSHTHTHTVTYTAPTGTSHSLKWTLITCHTNRAGSPTRRRRLRPCRDFRVGGETCLMVKRQDAQGLPKAWHLESCRLLAGSVCISVPLCQQKLPPTESERPAHTNEYLFTHLTGQSIIHTP